MQNADFISTCVQIILAECWFHKYLCTDNSCRVLISRNFLICIANTQFQTFPVKTKKLKSKTNAGRHSLLNMPALDLRIWNDSLLIAKRKAKKNLYEHNCAWNNARFFSWGIVPFFYLCLNLYLYLSRYVSICIFPFIYPYFLSVCLSVRIPSTLHKSKG